MVSLARSLFGCTKKKTATMTLSTAAVAGANVRLDQDIDSIRLKKLLSNSDDIVEAGSVWKTQSAIIMITRRPG